MDKIQFEEFCKKEFKSYGFEKYKRAFYLKGHDLLCGINLQKSDFSEKYYINYFYFIGDYKDVKNYPTYYDCDIDGRIIVMSKTVRDPQGECFLTSRIEYEEYTEEELKPFFDKELEEKILPPIKQGKKYILDNLNKLYFLTLHPKEVLQKLQEGIIPPSDE